MRARPGLLLPLLLGLVGCPDREEAPADVGARADLDAAPRPDPELPARAALFEASWEAGDYVRPVTEVYAALEQGHLFVGPDGLTEDAVAFVRLLRVLDDHGLDPRAVGCNESVVMAEGYRGDGDLVRRARLEVRLAEAFAYVLDHGGGLLSLERERTTEWAKNRWRERTIRYVETVARVRAEGMDAVLRDLFPPTVDYASLRAALRNYRELAAGEPFPDAPKMPRSKYHRLELGKTGGRVTALTRRLAAEGYFDLPPQDVFDEAVDAALRRYQRGHGLEEDGIAGPSVARWMKRTAAEKVLWLRTAMRRHRESRARRTPTHIRVNLPQFWLTASRDGETVLSFGVVVGDETEKEDEETKERSRPNATPLLQSMVSHVVWNPLWQVPDRVKQEELDLNVLVNPNWYAEHGYELRRNKDGSEHAVQLPGPDNSLGQLKVLFSNVHNVYMHDTPQRRYFTRGKRAYSHGCMRLGKPVELARFLLEPAGQWDAEEVRRLLEEPKEHDDYPKGLYERRWVKLKQRVPIFTEYQTVVADREGGVVFLADLYDLDRPYRSRLAREDRRLRREAARQER